MRHSSKRAVLFFLVLILGFCTSAAGDIHSYIPAVRNYSLPNTFSLCGETVPLDNPAIRERFDREFTIAVWNRAQVFLWLKRTGKFFPFIESALADAGLPQDLKYLAVAESALLSHIRSKAGAVGIWQFMPHTGRRNGLKKSYDLDERRHFELSTFAAITYLRELKDRFGKWNLALAGYNCGEQRLEKEMKKQQVNDYYRLNLPRETERFVFRIASIKLILENPEQYGYYISPEDIYKPESFDNETVSLPVSLHLTDVAKGLDTDLNTLKDLNPQFIGYYLPKGRHEIKVPEGKGESLETVITQLINTAKYQKARYYVVRKGDSLSGISQKTGVSISLIKRLNNLKKSIIHPGQRLRLSH